MPDGHLTADERYKLTYMNMAGFKQAEIARRLKRSPGTISRELKRNRDAFGHYHYESAQRIAEQRRG